MTEPTNIQKNVMRRVRIIRATRPLLSHAAVAVYLLTISLYLLGREVFVAQIVRNAQSLSGMTELVAFVESAFLHTTFIVQTLSVLALIAILWLAREFARLLVQPHHHGYA